MKDILSTSNFRTQTVQNEYNAKEIKRISLLRTGLIIPVAVAILGILLESLDPLPTRLKPFPIYTPLAAVFILIFSYFLRSWSNRIKKETDKYAQMLGQDETIGDDLIRSWLNEREIKNFGLLSIPTTTFITIVALGISSFYWPYLTKRLEDQRVKNLSTLSLSDSLVERQKSLSNLIDNYDHKDFSLLTLSSLVLEGANSSNLNFTRGLLKEVSIKRCRIRSSSFTETDAREATIFDSDLSESTFKGANLTSAQLTNSLFHYSDLHSAMMSHTNCTNSSFLNADLTSVDLSFSNLRGVIFLNADLSGANMEGIQNWRQIKSIEGAKISDVIKPPEGFIQWAISKGAIFIEKKVQVQNEP